MPDTQPPYYGVLLRLQSLHFLLKRAKAGDALCGSAAGHRARLAQLLGLVDREVA